MPLESLNSYEPIASDGALYVFPGVRANTIDGFEDEVFALQFLEQEHVLVVTGSSFNLSDGLHFRMTLLPEADVIADVFARIERVLARLGEGVSMSRHVT
ncbi:MAG: hypothetical protein M3R20_00825 [Pseudomonadota bacterium]|nr:hypothetical protein [Pseudomonadota bacterium]